MRYVLLLCVLIAGCAGVQPSAEAPSKPTADKVMEWRAPAGCTPQYIELDASKRGVTVIPVIVCEPQT